MKVWVEHIFKEGSRFHVLWEPLRGHAVLLWPDADEPGVEAMRELAGILYGMDCTTRIKIIEVMG